VGFVIRGLLAVGYSVLLLAWPAPTVAIMLALFAAFAVVDGSVALWTASKAASGERSSLVVQGLATIASGIVGMIWPQITALALLYVIGGWAVVKGVGEVSLAVKGAEFVEHPVLLGLAGVATVAFGLGMFVHPGAGALAVITLIAMVALVTGIADIATGVQAHRARRALAERRQPIHL
jgi:uncharacterized membrane protein HdeD (DUF308 family)